MADIKSPEEIEMMAEGGRRLKRILELLLKEVKPGVTTESLDSLSRELAEKEGGTSAFLGYCPPWADKAYPASICASVNETVVHGLPSSRPIEEGDVVTIDMGFLYNGLYTDTASTMIAGHGSGRAERLLKVTKKALHEGVKAARGGKTIGDIGWAVSKVVRKAGYEPAQGLVGHGIGRHLHEEPSVPNVGKQGGGEKLVPGMVIAIEPMVVEGSGALKELQDGSFVARDGSLSAHFEHTVVITEKGARVLT